jgi:carbamate kinase
MSDPKPSKATPGTTTPGKRRRAVVALGGNALLKPGQLGSPSELRQSAADVAGGLVPLLRADWSVLLVHGNGPQVGIELVRSEEASTKVPPFGLDLCVASTQGSIAALLETALRNVLAEESLAVDVAAVMSLVRVDRADPAFSRPTKPIGLFYSGYRARQLAEDHRARGWDLVEDAGRGWRPVVPSPVPMESLASPAVRTLLDAGFLVIGGGGGGVPVASDGSGQLATVEAVIDKDRTAALLAGDVGAELLIFLTGVPWVELNFGTPFAKRLHSLTIDEARHHLESGQFPAGSMGPKVQAAAQFARSGGRSLITSAGTLNGALSGVTGTLITPDDGRIPPNDE